MNQLSLAVALAAAALSTFCGTALASAELAAKYDCMGCHKAQSKVLGPAFKDVAKKYAGNPKAEQLMVEKIIKGGAGVWGPVPMAANPKIPREDVRKLAAWVLSQQ
jgi:cytochrome c